MNSDDSTNYPQDTVEKFGADLRELRLSSGNPTLVLLSNSTGISKSVLSDAFGGRRLPTERTVAGLIDVLGGDRALWIQRRSNITTRPTEEQRFLLSGSGSLRPRNSMGTQLAISLIASASVVSALVTSIVWATVFRPDQADAGSQGNLSPTTQYLAHADGVDPMLTVCHRDAVIAASEERLNGEFLVQMLYSNECMAVWGRVTRYDQQASGNSMSMLIYPQIDTESNRNQSREAFDLQSIYTTLMIEPEVEARVCGIATVTQGDEPIELGPQICI